MQYVRIEWKQGIKLDKNNVIIARILSSSTCRNDICSRCVFVYRPFCFERLQVDQVLDCKTPKYTIYALKSLTGIVNGPIPNKKYERQWGRASAGEIYVTECSACSVPNSAVIASYIVGSHKSLSLF